MTTFQDLTPKQQVRWLMTYFRTYPVHHPNHRLALSPVYICWILAVGHTNIDKLIEEIENETA